MAGTRKPRRATPEATRGPPATSDVSAASVKDKIAEAALRAFAQYGFDGTSVGDLARQCGVSQPLVHYHFLSKTQLWESSVTTEMKVIYRELRRSAQDHVDLDPISRFKVFLRSYINLTFRRPFIFAIIVKESDNASERFGWLRDQLLPQFYRIWEEEISMLKDKGIVHLGAPDFHIAQVVVGACSHFLSSRYRVLPLYGLDPTDPSLPRQHADLVIDIVVNGLCAPVARA